jgi:hypothetical protein
MSNTERQRRFRERNPGYFNRYKTKVDREATRQTLVALLAAAEKAEAEKAHATREPLALPAPVETIEIPGMNIIPAIAPMTVSEQVTIPLTSANSLAA